MKFRLEIDLGNDAMAKAEDVAHALQGVADVIDWAVAFGPGVNGAVKDANGNVVGHWVFGE